MSVKTLDFLVLNSITGGGGEYNNNLVESLFRFLDQGGHFKRTTISQETFCQYALKFGIDKILASDRLGDLSCANEAAVSRFGRCMGIFTRAEFVSAFKCFLLYMRRSYRF